MFSGWADRMELRVGGSKDVPQSLHLLDFQVQGCQGQLAMLRRSLGLDESFFLFDLSALGESWMSSFQEEEGSLQLQKWA